MTTNITDARLIDYNYITPPVVQPYNVVVSADSPWLYWYLNEASGTFADYGVPNPNPTNHPGIQVGTISRNVSPGLTGDGRTCIVSDGGIPSPGGVQASTLAHAGAPQTFEMLVQQTRFPPISDALMSMLRTGFGGSDYLLYGGCGPEPIAFHAGLYAVPPTDITWVGTDNAFSDGNIHQMTLTYTASGITDASLELFIDGVSKGAHVGANLNQLEMDQFLVGTNTSGIYSFAGKIQDPHIYQYISTPAQITAHYNAITNP